MLPEIRTANKTAVIITIGMFTVLRANLRLRLRACLAFDLKRETDLTCFHSVRESHYFTHPIL